MASYKRRTDDTQPAGALRHRVTFLQRRVTVNSGITKESWEPAFTCWAMVEPLNSREYWQAAALGREDEQRVTVRYRRDVDAAMRLRHAGRVFDITSIVNPNARNVKLELLVKSIVPDGK
ncbi:phage head closure protein, partial [Eubacteriales bacterium OttesenSCG-928-A19]|nr:phage head closure protein [Eubacteriales bacterium OttesenSCG-928-A19]